MQEKSERRPNSVRSQEMRGKLVEVARKLFAANGFASTGTPEIVREANVTRGALYHHFADKTDLFRAVVREEAASVAKEIELATLDARDALWAIGEGTSAYFRAMRLPGRVRILLLDGPAVLGPMEMAAIDRETGGNTLEQGLAQLIAGQDLPVNALTQILSAGFDSAAISIESGQDESSYLAAFDALFRRLGAMGEAG